MSALCGSTAIFSKYQPRPQSAGSPERRRQVAPASSLRKTPPCPVAGAKAQSLDRLALLSPCDVGRDLLEGADAVLEQQETHACRSRRLAAFDDRDVGAERATPKGGRHGATGDAAA